jgi:hypothetical protein
MVSSKKPRSVGSPHPGTAIAVAAESWDTEVCAQWHFAYIKASLPTRRRDLAF